MNNTRLEYLREEKELTKKGFSKKIEVSDSVYSRWERGKDNIPTKRMVQIANFHQVNIDYMLGLTDKKVVIISNEKLDINLISKRVREIRKDFKESLREFSKRFNTTSSTWSAYESGKVLILGSFLIELSKISNVSIDWILGRTEEKFLNK